MEDVLRDQVIIILLIKKNKVDANLHLLLILFVNYFVQVKPDSFISVMFFAFSSSTSNATIPLNMEKLSEMGVSRDVSSFTIPLGATINMDGTAIMQGCAVMFAAQAYGIDLGTSALITVVFTAVLASVGTAGVPSVGLITLNMVFNSVGLPVDAIGIIMELITFSTCSELQ